LGLPLLAIPASIRAHLSPVSLPSARLSPMPTIHRSIWFSLLCGWLTLSAGCMTMRPVAELPRTPNPLPVAGGSHEYVWEQVVEVIHRYKFQIARENRLDGVIESQYKTGASLMEPWHEDSVGFDSRLESTLQSIRRRVVVTISPGQGGHLVNLQVFKELEDVRGLAANSTGGATFQESTPLERDLNLVVGQTTPSGWIAKGRDTDLEQVMLADLQCLLNGSR
jgi:hypothetical protein